MLLLEVDEVAGLAGSRARARGREGSAGGRQRVSRSPHRVSADGAARGFMRQVAQRQGLFYGEDAAFQQWGRALRWHLAR